MAKTKRSYYLPGKLIKLFDRECQKYGYVREKVVAAAVYEFLTSTPIERHRMFASLDEMLSRKSR